MEFDLNLQCQTRLDVPNFYNYCYTVKEVTDDNTSVFTAEEFYEAKGGAKKDISLVYLCFDHGVKSKPVENCRYCIKINKFPYAFMIKCIFGYYICPQPTLYTQKNFNYFNSFIEKAHGSSILEKNKNNCLEYQKSVVNKFYTTFFTHSFKHGSITILRSGKSSLIRNKVLASCAKGLRMTLTIDCKLGPNYIAIPQRIYNDMNLLTTLVVINRSPSINSRCIYVCELLTYNDPDDCTMHINPFLCDGLHADQDGDDLSMLYLEQLSEEPSYEQRNAITELQDLSWKYGSRHDLEYKPRYTFSQHHKWILYKHDEWFKRNSKLWFNLSKIYKDTRKRCDVVMNLGCSIMHDEVDDFITLLIDFTCKRENEVIPVKDLINATGAMEDVVQSGAKGSKTHLDAYLDLLNGNDYDKFMENSEKKFDELVKSSFEMSKEGARHFTLLYGLNSIEHNLNTFRLNGKIIINNVNSATFMGQNYYNEDSVRYVFDNLPSV